MTPALTIYDHISWMNYSDRIVLLGIFEWCLQITLNCRDFIARIFPLPRNKLHEGKYFLILEAWKNYKNFVRPLKLFESKFKWVLSRRSNKLIFGWSFFRVIKHFSCFNNFMRFLIEIYFAEKYSSKIFY